MGLRKGLGFGGSLSGVWHDGEAGGAFPLPPPRAGRGRLTPFWSHERHRDRAPFLKARAAIMRAVRDWFHDQGFTEVEPQALALSPGAEVHVDAFEASGRFLHTSPEFAMKKLLAAGEEKIFFLGKCWRRGEIGPLHAEEFTMLEWYRAGDAYQRVMQDCIALARLAASATGARVLRWRNKTCDPFAETERFKVREAFERYLPSSLAEEGLGEEGRSNAPTLEHVDAPNPLTPSPQGRGSELHDAFSAAITRIEPHLGSPALTLLYEYPVTEAALAQRCAHDPNVAERFELYACGVELANGFGELTDPAEQRARLAEAMTEKHRRYGRSWPIDEDFLAALAQMPPASGVALGLDRLVMLASGARHINDVLWTPP
ncbi:MAG: EF-P lysine aminoacylase GenX [Hyphomonadaceae bacterium]|nr:EF-P lysine aminoacylase GenX [Hyphomonadaceae bacterium]